MIAITMRSSMRVKIFREPLSIVFFSAVPHFFELVISASCLSLCRLFSKITYFRFFLPSRLVKLERILVNMPVPELLAYGQDQLLSHISTFSFPRGWLCFFSCFTFFCILWEIIFFRCYSVFFESSSDGSVSLLPDQFKINDSVLREKCIE